MILNRAASNKRHHPCKGKSDLQIISGLDYWLDSNGSNIIVTYDDRMTAVLKRQCHLSSLK